MSRIFFICATKSRPALFRKKAYPFLLESGYNFLVGIEESQVEEYEAEGEIKNVVTYQDNFGHVRAFHALALEAKRRGAEFVFKIDDDVSGFTGVGNSGILANLPRFEASFDQYPKLGGIAFPYEQEFYRTENKLYSHMNHRLQTCYLVRVDFFFCERRLSLSAFEDFAMFLEIVEAGFFTLLCPVNKIKCSPVGDTPGGLQDGARADRSAEALLKIQKLYSGFKISARQKPSKSWKVEPDMSKDKRLKKIAI